MTDLTLAIAPFAVAIIVLGIGIGKEWNKRVTVALSVVSICVSGLGSWKLRQEILSRQMEQVSQMEHRNEFARKHVDDWKLSAAASLLEQVRLEGQKIAKSKWTLPVVKARCEDVLSEEREIRELINSEQAGFLEKYRLIAENVKQDALQAKLQTGELPKRIGRAMVWDFTNENMEQAYELLPDSLKASSKDGLLTMFCIRSRNQILVGHYSVSNQPGYREELEISVIYWPSKQCAGAFVVNGGSPASFRKVRHSPGYGSSVRIKEWIEKLPVGTADDLVGDRSLDQVVQYLPELSKSNSVNVGIRVQRREPGPIVRVGRTSKNSVQKENSKSDTEKNVIPQLDVKEKTSTEILRQQTKKEDKVSKKPSVAARSTVVIVNRENSEFRIWRTVEGTTISDARLVKFDSGEVELEKSNGDTISHRLVEFANPDRAYVRELILKETKRK